MAKDRFIRYLLILVAIIFLIVVIMLLQKRPAEVMNCYPADCVPAFFP